MQRFRGQLMQEGKVVQDTVVGLLQRLATSAAEQSWAGHFRVVNGTNIAPGKYQLVLADGRGETIMVDRVPPENHPATVIHFKGAGMLSKPTISVVRPGKK